MSGQRWPTLSAALFAVVVHTLLLGIAASLGVSYPREPRALVTITLMPQAAPLPVVAGGGETLRFGPVPSPLPDPPLSQPFQRERRTAPKPAVTKNRLPPTQPPRMKPRPVPSVRKEDVSPPQPREDVPHFVTRAVTNAPRRGEEPSTVSRTPTGDLEKGAARNNEAEGNANTTGDPDRGSSGGGARERKGAMGSGESALAQPHYGVNPKPVYPLLARRMGAQGEVLLRVRVQQDGNVAAVELARSSGFTLLDEAATRTVRDSWRFIPARLNGVAIESWVEVPIKFVLDAS